MARARRRDSRRVLLAPTFLKYGLQRRIGRAATNLYFHIVSPDRLLVTLAQFFSFASLEINRFVATDNAKRLMFIVGHPWIVPLAAVVLVAGFVQPVWMLVSAFRRLASTTLRRARAAERSDWHPLRALVAFTVVLVYASYWFVKEEPQAHAFFAVAPIAFIFAASCWALIDSPRWRRVAAVVLAANVSFHAALAWIQGPEQSLYTNREVVAAAIRRETAGDPRTPAPVCDRCRPARHFRSVPAPRLQGLEDRREHRAHRNRRRSGLDGHGDERQPRGSRFRSLIYRAIYTDGRRRRPAA